MDRRTDHRTEGQMDMDYAANADFILPIILINILLFIEKPSL